MIITQRPAERFFNNTIQADKFHKSSQSTSSLQKFQNYDHFDLTNAFVDIHIALRIRTYTSKNSLAWDAKITD